MDEVILTHLPTGIMVRKPREVWDLFLLQRRANKYSVGELYNRFMCIHVNRATILTYCKVDCDSYEPNECDICPFNHGQYNKIPYQEDCFTFEYVTSN